MTTSFTMLLLIIGCALVTWIPRIIPFLVVRKIELPPIILRWLSYIPICILSALVFESIFHINEKSVTIHWMNLIALLPTLATAIFTKSLAKTVVVGVISMAILQYSLQ